MKTIRSIALALTLLPAGALAQEAEVTRLRAAGRDPATLVQLGRAMRRAGRFDEGVRTLQQVRDPARRTEALWEIARVRFDQGVFQPARAACMAFPSGRLAPPEMVFRNHVCLARAYLVWNRVALAQRELNAVRGSNDADGELRLVIADMHRLAADVQAAETAYQSAAQSLPGRDEPYLGLGQLYEMAQRTDDAEAQFRRALTTDEADPQASMMLGRLLLRRKNNPTDALVLLRRANEARPNWAEAQGLLGEALLATRAHAEALPILQNTVRLSPTQPGAQSALGRTLLALGRYPEAEVPLRAAIQQVSTDASAYAGLADVLEHTNRDTEATEAWEAAIDRAPNEPSHRLRAAQLAHRMQLNSFARAHLDRLLTDDPAYAPALFLRGRIALEEGARAEARQFLTRALAGHGEIDRAAVQQAIQEVDAPPGRPRRR